MEECQKLTMMMRASYPRQPVLYTEGIFVEQKTMLRKTFGSLAKKPIITKAEVASRKLITNLLFAIWNEQLILLSLFTLLYSFNNYG